MSVVVKGMEMPKVGDKFQVCIDANGNIFLYRIGSLDDIYYVEKLPKHGRLIDADALKNDLLYDVAKDTEYLKTRSSDNERENIQFDKDCKQNCASYVSDAPTVLEAGK